MNHYVTEKAQSISQALLIGLTDNAVEGTFTWLDGNQVSYKCCKYVKLRDLHENVLYFLINT